MNKLKTLYLKNDNLLENFYNRVFEYLSNSEEAEEKYLKMFITAYEKETDLEDLEDLEDIDFDLPDFESINDIYYKDENLKTNYQKNIKKYNPKNVLKIFNLITYEDYLNNFKEVKDESSFQLMAYKLLEESKEDEVIIYISVKASVIPKKLKKNIVATNVSILNFDKIPMKSILLQKYATELKFLNINKFPTFLHITKNEIKSYPIIPINEK